MEAKVCYRIKDDAYEIYIRQTKESVWELYRRTPCLSVASDTSPEYVHYTFVTMLLCLADLGYKIIKGGSY